MKQKKDRNKPPGKKRLTEQQIAVSSVLGKLLAKRYMRQKRREQPKKDVRRASRVVNGT